MGKKDPPELKILKIPLEAGRHYTLYYCSDTAMTVRREIRVTEVFTKPEFRPNNSRSVEGKWRLGKFKEGRQRGTFLLDVDAAGTLIIAGLLHGVACDHERWRSFTMSATINMAASPERIRKLVDRNLNPNFSGHDRIIAYPRPLDAAAGDHGTLVYPNAPSTHPVILQMRKALGKEAP